MDILSTPWGFLAWIGFLVSVLTTFTFLPLYLKNSKTFLGLWYQEITENDGDAEEQQIITMVLSRLSAFLYAVVAFCGAFSVWRSGELAADVASHEGITIIHFITGISFGVTIYRLCIQFANSDWTDRMNSFLQNRLVWCGCAKLVVYFHALQNENLGYFLMYRYLMEIATIFECPMFIMSVIYNEEGGILYYVCLVGFMVSLPLKVLMILFFWFKLLFNFFGGGYAAVSLFVKLALILWTLLTDFLTVMKIINT